MRREFSKVLEDFCKIYFPNSIHIRSNFRVKNNGSTFHNVILYKLMILLKGFKFKKRINSLKEVPVFPHCPLSESSSRSSSRSSVLWPYQGMTSSLFTVIFGREGSHWVQATFQFIRELCPIQLNGNVKMEGLSTSYLGFRYSHSFLPIGTGSISVLPTLKGGFYVSLSQLG